MKMIAGAQNSMLFSKISVSQNADKRMRTLGIGMMLIIPWSLIYFRGLADGLLIATGLLFLLRSYKTKDWQWLKRTDVRLMAALWLWISLPVSLFALQPAVSFPAALAWIRFPLFYSAVVTWLAQDPRLWRGMALNGAVLLGFILADTLIQYITGTSLTGHPVEGKRLTGPFDNVKVGIYTTRMMFPFLGIMLACSLMQANRLRVVICLMLFFALVLMILLSGERTAFLLAALGTLIMAAVCAWYFRKARLYIFALVTALAAASAGLIATQSSLISRLDESKNHIGHFTQEPYGQLVIAAVNLALERPFTGVGVRNFNAGCMELMARDVLQRCDAHAHNPYLEWLSETGLPGLLGFSVLVCVLLATALKALRNSTDTISYMLAAAALATACVHFFPLAVAQSGFSNWPGILLWYSLSLALGALNIGMARNPHEQ